MMSVCLDLPLPFLSMINVHFSKMPPCLILQSGQDTKPMKMPSNAVFQPQKRHIDAISEKRDFLGQSKVSREIRLRNAVLDE